MGTSPARGRRWKLVVVREVPECLVRMRRKKKKEKENLISFDFNPSCILPR